MPKERFTRKEFQAILAEALALRDYEKTKKRTEATKLEELVHNEALTKTDLDENATPFTQNDLANAATELSIPSEYLTHATNKYPSPRDVIHDLRKYNANISMNGREKALALYFQDFF